MITAIELVYLGLHTLCVIDTNEKYNKKICYTKYSDNNTGITYYTLVCIIHSNKMVERENCREPIENLHPRPRYTMALCPGRRQYCHVEWRLACTRCKRGIMRRWERRSDVAATCPPRHQPFLCLCGDIGGDDPMQGWALLSRARQTHHH